MIYTIANLKEINNNKIKELSKNNKELQIQLLIKEILNENRCFFKMKMDIALDILNNLIEEENVHDTYLSLIDSDKF